MRVAKCDVTVVYRQIENGKRANQIRGFTIDHGKFILMAYRTGPAKIRSIFRSKFLNAALSCGRHDNAGKNIFNPF